MDIGDIIQIGDKRYRVRGFDPASVDPRLVYLEDLKSTKTFTAVLDDSPPASEDDPILRLREVGPSISRDTY